MEEIYCSCYLKCHTRSWVHFSSTMKRHCSFHKGIVLDAENEEIESFSCFLLLLLHSSTRNHCLCVGTVKILLPSSCLWFHRVLGGAFHDSPISLLFNLTCFVSSFTHLFSQVKSHYTAFNYNLNKIVWEMEWVGVKPTVYVWDVLDMGDTLTCNFHRENVQLFYFLRGFLTLFIPWLCYQIGETIPDTVLLPGWKKGRGKISVAMERC